MAKRKRAPQNNTSSIETNTFVKGMVKDFNPSYTAKQNWTHARNAANNSIDGDAGVLGNEPANLKCAEVPYTVIGTIHQYGDQWVLFSTDNTNSEIGIFDDSKCEYTTLVNDSCLSFKKEHLIVGAAKENFDCSWQVYWDDGLNPSRTLNLDNIPYKRTVTSADGADCVTYADTTELDCEQLRIAPLLDTPNISLTKATDGGQLRNGSYQAYIAYVENEQRVTDYIGISNVQSLFDHNNTAGSLDLAISNLDEDYEFFELVILSNNQNNYVAKKIGLYSTRTKNIGIDFIDPALPSIPIEQIPLRNPAYEKSDAMYVVNDYLIRQGPTEQFDFNYQPRANKIKARWVVAEYPKDYYRKGGNKTGLMRDEQYAFFIRWIYNTGERSASYHIPGRAPNTGEDEPASGDNAFAGDLFFQTRNTANLSGGGTGLTDATDDGQGTIIAKGQMGYWQSTEKYPDQQPEIWDDLCGKHIRHHKMPTEETHSSLELVDPATGNIRILGVEFYNIQRPVDNDGKVIENIVGYEFLRGSREGAKSILGKGIFRNMRKYDIKDSDRQGLYPNYPYNDRRPDPFFHDKDKKTTGAHDWQKSRDEYGSGLIGVTDNVFTFHSPELMFKKPFLNAYETRIYGELSGTANGQFIVSEKHPQQKLLRKLAVMVASVFGMGYGLYQLKGIREESTNTGQMLNLGIGGTFVLGSGDIAAPATSLGGLAQAVPISLAKEAVNLLIDNVVDFLIGATTDAAYITTGTFGGKTAEGLADGAKTLLGAAQNAIPGSIGQTTIFNATSTPASSVPGPISIATGLLEFAGQFAVGTNELLELLYNIMSFQDTALKYNSHGFYDTFTKRGGTYRVRNIDSNFIGSALTNFGTGSTGSKFKINNLFRPTTVAVNTENNLTKPSTNDNSRFTIGSIAGASADNFNDLDIEYSTDISCLYGALKYNFENQYGQLNQIKQVPMRGNVELLNVETPPAANTKLKSAPIFSGDVYIGRYTEKTIMPIFTDFLYGQPNGFAYDYHRRVNIPYPRYWVDSTKYDITRIIQKFTSVLNATLGGASWSDSDFSVFNYYVDRAEGTVDLATSAQVKQAADGKMPLFNLKNCYMYTHVNGVQDFYVESEVNLAQRDWEEAESKRHYDHLEYTETSSLFDAAHIKEDNFYRYDYSLSAGRFITNLTSFGNVQPTDYDPKIAETCYSYYPKRLIYSLQAQQEAKKDFWRIFLPNNYKDFKNQVTVIKPVSKSGSIIFFPYQSPQMFQGVDQLQTDLGTKLTIGDGGLFSQPMQNIVNSDLSNEYGSCESARSVLNTPMGIFYISQAQGKVFQYTGQLVNLANQGMKWWFNKYLPSQLIRQFPELETSPLGDNPVAGVGCQVIYDINNDIVYFTKRDFRVKEEFINSVSFNAEELRFTASGNPSSSNSSLRFDLEDYSSGYPIILGDPLYFDDCSWTVSYDPKAKAWVSFHDWHPELCMSSIKNFLTTKTIDVDGETKGSIWRHNSRCDLFANYYGESYPWEVELVENTGQSVHTVRSLEYQLESYVYKGDLENGCADDRWHDLNFNFDQLIVYNTEQVSGKLNLVLNPSYSDASDPIASLNYPQINLATEDIDILYSKEEQKYRVNQFWDVTKDRGEFTNVPAPAEEVILNTECNGYIRTLNRNNIDLEKVEEQRKKFRHYYNKFILTRLESDNRKMLLKLNNTKLNLSMR
jgi:hypothetical protein